MSAPEPEATGLLHQIMQWAWAGVVALGGIVVKGMRDDINGKASQDSVAALNLEMVQRKEAETKLFDKLEEVRKDMNDKHISILNAIHENRK